MCRECVPGSLITSGNNAIVDLMWQYEQPKLFTIGTDI